MTQLSFIARALIAPGFFAAAAHAGDALITIDSHVDIPDTYMREPRYDAGTDTELRVDLGKMERGGLDAAFFVVYVGQGTRDAAGYAKAFDIADAKFDAIHTLTDTYPDRIRLALTPEDVRRHHADGVLSAMIGIENGYVIGEDLARLDEAYRRGARYLGLTHVGHNAICTSSMPREDLGDAPPGDVGLSDFGRRVVARANDLGMMVDVSHSSSACVRDVLAASTAPVIASHSSARALVDHPRNLTDEELRAIARGGGVVQIVAYTSFVKADAAREAAGKALEAAVAAAAGAEAFDHDLHGELPQYLEGVARIDREHPIATLDEFVDHIDHAVRVAGIDHVGIASDFDGGGRVTGWSDASETPNVAAALRARGYDDGEIAKLWGGNLLRVWSAVERIAATAIDDTQRFDRWFDDTMSRYALPGMAVAVVENDEVIYARTAGETQAGSGDPITRKTLFKIASNSKAMTTALLARLVDAGKLRWDDAVIEHLPQLRMHDAWVTRELQVRDLLIHNSGLGLGAGDLMLWPEPNRFTRKDVIAALAHLEPASSFRSRYAYDNILYIVAGEVAAAAGGASYEDLMRREVFEPLDMSRCEAGGFVRADAGSVAQPHRLTEDRENVVIRSDGDVVPTSTSAAAGGIRCSLDDMIAWMRAWLDEDDADTGDWLSDAQREAVWTPQMPMPLSQRQREWDGANLLAYGYGWRVSDVRGMHKVAHTGTLAGMYSSLILLPEREVGIVILVNGLGNDARAVLGQAFVDHYTGVAFEPTIARYADVLDRERDAAPPDSHAPDTSGREPATADAMRRWLGVYRDRWFGELTVCARDGGVRVAARKSPLLDGVAMQSRGRWLVDWYDDSVDAEAWLQFDGGESGAPATLRMSHVYPDADFSYDWHDLRLTRVGDCITTPAQAGLVDVRRLVPDIDLDIRYAGGDNFVGTPIRGYHARKCYLLEPVAKALAQVERSLRENDLRLRIFDCYRPERAVRHFVEWLDDASDTRTKAAYYPNLDKRDLVGDYIAPFSGHSRGATVDLTLLDCGDGVCEPLDMGTPFDFFDPRANTDSADVTAAQRANRHRLRDAMRAAGFENYPMEWWHYTLPLDPPADVAFDVVVR